MASFDSGAPLFERSTPVIRLTGGKVPGARWVLWPLFAWRVVAPVPRERRLNLFQRAVLGLAQAGVVRSTEVAERLLIAPDLAALVASELQAMQLLDHARTPTPRGRAALEDAGEEAMDEARVGHVFSDAFTGKLWPRFLSGDLPLVEVELNDRGWPVMVERATPGDPSKGWEDPAFCILPPDAECTVARPDPRDVIRAARLHGRQRELNEVDDERHVPELQRVSFVDDRPHPYLLALRARAHASGDWMVDDPFGHGEAGDLRARLEDRLDTHKGLRAWLGPLLQTDAPDVRFAHLRVQASWKIEERLTLAIRQHEPVHDRLVAMQRALLEASSGDAPRDKWDDVLVKAQRAVERSLLTVHGSYRDAGSPLFARLSETDRVLNGLRLEAIAGELGFQTPLPATLSSVRRGKIEHAEQHMAGSLRPLLVLALLCADREDQHPLRRAARAHPDLLHRLDALATARDRAAHDGDGSPAPDAGRHVDTVFATVEALLLSR